MLENDLFSNGAFSFDITYQSNGEVFYNGDESRILTVGEPKVTGDGAEKNYAFTVTVNPPIDSEDAESTLVFGVNYAETTEYQASRLTIVRKGLGNVNTPQGALIGVFSLGGSGQVYFAKGNLEYDSLLNQYSFAESQYKGEKGVLGSDRYVSHFPLTPVSDKSGEPIYVFEEVFSRFPIQDAEPSDDDNYWFIPTAEQWDYLIYKRENADNLRVSYIINEELNPGEQSGLILLPDNYLEMAAEKGWDVSNIGRYFVIRTEEELKELESRGALILAPFGDLNSSNIYNDIPFEESRAMFGVYWSSSVQNEGEGKTSAIALVLNDVKSEDNGVKLIRVHQDVESARNVCIRLAYRKFK